MSTVNLQVAYGVDDTCDAGYGDWSSNSGYYLIGVSTGGGWYHAWSSHRFRNVLIPKGSTIDSAIFKFYCIGQVSPYYAPTTRVYFESADSPAAPTSSGDLTGRSIGTGVDWTPGSGTSVWFNSPELKTILQTVINRTGWASGNALQIHFRDYNCGDGNWKYWCDADTNVAYACKLDVNFTPPAMGKFFLLFGPN
jgi:hypothetical protein